MEKRSTKYELLKVVALCMIIISHSLPRYGSYQTPGWLDFTAANPWRQFPLLLVMQYFGQQGNAIFVTVSAWFLVDSDTVRSKKIWRFVLDTVFFSLLFLAGYELSGLNLPPREIFRYAFPFLHMNNWFVATYMIYYLIHPALNWIIRRLNQRQHLGVLLIGGVFYSLIPTLISEHAYYSSNMTGFILIYFIVAYLKLYRPELCADRRKNRAVLLASIAALIAAIFALNALGLRVAFLRRQMMRFAMFQSPLMTLIALSAMNLLGSHAVPYTRWINTVSSLSLLLYIIHENVLFALYGKPAFWTWIYESFGYRWIILWTLGFAAACFLGSLAIALLYRRVLGKATDRLIDAFDKAARRRFSSLLDRLTAKERYL